MENEQELELSYTAGGNVKWHRSIEALEKSGCSSKV